MKFTFTLFLNNQGKPRVRFSWREFLPDPLVGETLAGYVNRAYRAAYNQETDKFGERIREPERFFVHYDRPDLEIHDFEDDAWTWVKEDSENNAIRHAFDLCIAKALPEYALKYKVENGIALLDPDHTPNSLNTWPIYYAALRCAGHNLPRVTSGRHLP